MPKKSMMILTEAMLYVLMVLQNGEKCGIDIAEAIDQLTDKAVPIGPATLYTILAKFEKIHYIRETDVHGRKRIYAITPLGLEAYQAELLRLRRCIADSEKAAYLMPWRDRNE